MDSLLRRQTACRSQSLTHLCPTILVGNNWSGDWVHFNIYPTVILLLPTSTSTFISSALSTHNHKAQPHSHNTTSGLTLPFDTLPHRRLHRSITEVYLLDFILPRHLFCQYLRPIQKETGPSTLPQDFLSVHKPRSFGPEKQRNPFLAQQLNFGFLFAMHNVQVTYPTPPSTPPPRQLRSPPTPESRIGTFLGRSLELKGILGTGAYGVVYSAIDHITRTWYAVKALSKTNANGEPLDRRQREFQSREIQLHYAASAHPNIVSMLKIVDDPDCTYVVLEYCPEGDLFSNITERGRYIGNDAEVQRAFLQILNAVEHCHRLGIYHRDLKPENILVSNGGDRVLLADFGLATTDPESEDHGCGSTFYMSPGRFFCSLLSPLHQLTHFPLFRMSGPIITARIIPMRSQRHLVPGCHSCQPDLWPQSVETGFR